MNCREVQNKLTEFYEDQLHGKDAEHIRDHLEICPLCRDELSSIERVIVGLKSQRLPDPGETFWRDFPKRVREAFYEGDRPIRDPILPRVWKGFYRTARWLTFSKPLGAAVSTAAIVLVIAGLVFFKPGWFRTGTRGIGEETLEGSFGGIGAVVSPFTPLMLGNLSLHQLNDISVELMGRLDEMGSLGEQILKKYGLFQEEEVLAQLEGLSSEELDFVYDVLKTKYLKSTSSVSMPIG